MLDALDYRSVDSGVASPSRMTATSTRTSSVTTTTPTWQLTFPEVTIWPSTTSESPSSTPPTSTIPSAPVPVYRLGDHPIFGIYGALFDGNEACQLDSWPSDADRGRRFYESARVCLDRGWGGFLRFAKSPWSSPGIFVIGGRSVDTPCGYKDMDAPDSNWAAFYCAANSTIYMSIPGVPPGQYGNHPGIYLAVFAHEYAHHVQSSIGIMRAAWNARREAGTDSPQGLEFSRRLELQAQCLSGAFVGSQFDHLGEDEYALAQEDQYRGDGQQSRRDHGTNQHAYRWWADGAFANSNRLCNTWLAPAERVS
ncbi:metalloprotease [Mycobacterium sp. CBMA271]|nr:metalloprotease [Mycobacteroides sp. CBMA 271]